MLWTQVAPDNVGMQTDFESLYIQLSHLIAEMPELGGSAPITPEINRWLGRAAELVQSTGQRMDAISLSVASDGLNSVLRQHNAQQIAATVFRALAYAEARAPEESRGAFVGVGAAFDALKAVGKLLAEAQHDVLIIDPYLDPKVLTDFAEQAVLGVTVRLLGDAFYTKHEAMRPAVSRWMQQFGQTRPLDVRLSQPRALHDRLILIDGFVAWSLTQSLKNFAGRSPASVLRMDSEMSKMKNDWYGPVWAAATPVT